MCHEYRPLLSPYCNFSQVISHMEGGGWMLHFYTEHRLGLYNEICWCHCVIIFDLCGCFCSFYGECIVWTGIEPCRKNLTCSPVPHSQKPQPEGKLCSLHPAKSGCKRGHTLGPNSAGPSGAMENLENIKECLPLVSNPLVHTLLHPYSQSALVVLGQEIFRVISWGRRRRGCLLVIWVQLQWD